MNFHTQVLNIENVTNDEIFSEIRKFWELEAIGIMDEAKETTFDVKIEKRTDRYYVNLPWKDNHQMLCDNYRVSANRLLINLSRMQNNPDLLQAYEIMDSQKKAGIVEEVTNDEEPVLGRTYYMPLHAVVQKDKSTIKTRIVYDASRKSKGSSLNECLHSGSPEFTDLLATLLRFRCYKVGITADIQQTFLSVGIKEEDRDALRFYG